jgi:hypothetical protein
MDRDELLLRCGVLLDKQEITEAMASYSRGVDRMDMDLTRSVWHEDGTADYGRPALRGAVADVLRNMWETHREFDRHSHQTCNRLIRVEGDLAVSETYGIFCLRKAPANGRVRERIVRGRYLDRWSRRHGRWAIDHRGFVTDFLGWIEYPVADSSGSPFSTRDEADPSFALLAPGTASMVPGA